MTRRPDKSTTPKRSDIYCTVLATMTREYLRDAKRDTISRWREQQLRGRKASRQPSEQRP